MRVGGRTSATVATILQTDKMGDPLNWLEDLIRVAQGGLASIKGQGAHAWKLKSNVIGDRLPCSGDCSAPRGTQPDLFDVPYITQSGSTAVVARVAANAASDGALH